MLVKKQEKLKKKKAIIVDALKRCLESDVYSRITVQNIADEAGFSKGGVLHYFKTKEDIYLELIESIFSELERSHIDILKRDLTSKEIAPLSALLGVESFIFDKTNTRIVLNLILYAFEEPKIMELFTGFLHKHKDFYTNLIIRSRKDRESKRKSDLDPVYLSRIAQSIVLFIGILEIMDPSSIDYVEIVRYISTLLKG
ncbi:MAG TPA: TetR/AcrR family transcriptional regulator [Spirochaetota bacterium]|nr:TetR/AcrR family transcriptional regulator [Spirochaetota bacterium]HRZ27742.1 TetR/AcrR family transcriptional regulator [Spirochaetota bacterium]HSA14025.1 TetR/AcrR family transcriptional regulator [Spirochaetota bacterium]